MLASTWFQGSIWPPGNHGMLPSGSWTAAIASTVASTSSKASTADASGRCIAGRFRHVQDQALAQHGVETALQVSRPGRASDHLPGQEAMVDAGQQGIVAPHPDYAFQPPVGRVQGVGMGTAAGHQAGVAEAAQELVGTVDPDVASWVVVVLLRESPADTF